MPDACIPPPQPQSLTTISRSNQSVGSAGRMTVNHLGLWLAREQSDIDDHCRCRPIESMRPADFLATYVALLRRRGAGGLTTFILSASTSRRVVDQRRWMDGCMGRSEMMIAAAWKKGRGFRKASSWLTANETLSDHRWMPRPVVYPNATHAFMRTAFRGMEKNIPVISALLPSTRFYY